MFIKETTGYREYEKLKSERLNLLSRVGKKIGSASQFTELVKQTMRMTQYALKASASSVLLLDEETDELYFDFAEGAAGQALRRIRMSSQSGIAGWVTHHKRPLIVNDVTKDRRFYKKVDEATGFATKSMICVPLMVHRNIIGVIEVLNKLDGSEFNEGDLESLTAIASVTAMMIENDRLQQAVTDGYKSTINALATAVDAKDPYTAGHSQRVTQYALLGGNSLSLSEDELTDLEHAGILHDIGKLGVPDSILLKAGRLNPEELLVIRQHPVIGARIIDGIAFLEEAKKLVLYHHERYDGKGYPHGLKGEEIPIGASLLSVADAFDTMTTDRAYRPAIGIEQALDELHICSGTQFCPLAVDGFIAGFDTTNIVQEAPPAQTILSRQQTKMLEPQAAQNTR